MMAVGMLLAAATLDTAQAVFAVAWWGLVVVVVRSDLSHFMIPDEASIGILLLGLCHAAVEPWSGGGHAGEIVLAVILAALAGLAAALVLWLIGSVFRWTTGRNGLGFGDVKLAGASGVWLSLTEQTMALQFATFAALGLILLIRLGGRRTDVSVIPFGAFLAPAAWFVHIAVLAAPDLLGLPSWLSTRRRGEAPR